MSTTTVERRLDITGSTTPTLGRLTGIELRKMADTRSGRWLLVTIVLVTAAVVTAFWFVSEEADRTFLNFANVTVLPQALLLPVLGILLVTSEWTQRTAMVTFTLVPQRGRVVAAKTVAALVFGLLAVALTFVVAALATLVGGASGAWDGVGAEDVSNFVLLQALAVVQGVAFGLVLQSSAAAIAAYFVLPIAFSVVAGLWDAVRDAAPWLDMTLAQEPLFEGGVLSGEQWAHLGSTTLLWVVLPFAVGVWRVLQAEVK